MDISKFIITRPFLYHLTDQRNLDYIGQKKGILFSTTEIIQRSELNADEKEKILRERRPNHTKVRINGFDISIRDQKPISIRNLSKCLTDGWSYGDFLYHLNNRVFFWPTIPRLSRHFNRYADERPLIIRVSSREIFELNQDPEFCRLNSGATRSSSHYGGAPPQRGKDTFLKADQYPYSVSGVAEVTFINMCQLPKVISLSNDPLGPWNNTVI